MFAELPRGKGPMQEIRDVFVVYDQRRWTSYDLDTHILFSPMGCVGAWNTGNNGTYVDIAGLFCCLLRRLTGNNGNIVSNWALSRETHG